MAILSKAHKLDNFGSHNLLKLSLLNFYGLCSNFVDCESFLESNFFFNWDLLHARLNSHYQAWSYKKGSTKKKLQDTENLFRKNLQLKDTC